MNSEFNRAVSFAIRLLSKRDYASFTLRRKVEEKFPSVNSKDVISYLESKGYINDERIAYNYAISKVEIGWGKRKIRYKLLEKGIEKSTVDEVLSKVEIPVENVKRLLRKRFGEDPDRDNLRKFLLNRGFTLEEIEEILSDKI